MKTSLSAASLALLLVACGGGADSPAISSASRQALHATQAASRAPAEYTDLVQRMYLGFFGRPADALGLPYWLQQFSDANLPLSAAELSLQYDSNPAIRRFVDAFAGSAEAQQLYTGNNTAFVNAVYLNAFNRNAEEVGRAYWAGFIDRNELTRAQVLLRILQGAQNADATVLGAKLQAATYFTAALDQPAEIAAYDGESANQGARDLLGTITATTDVAAIKQQIDDYIAVITGNPDKLVVKYYVGYHYLQDMNNAPLYSAYSSYAGSGAEPPGLSGRTVYGVTPQTVTWTRDVASGALVYAAPVVASAALPATVLPELAMLCGTVVTANGDVTKSTDVLVARSARQLTDASQLAGQTLSVYRENCAIGGSHVTRFSFDAQGNGSFPSGVGLLTVDALTVTSVLNGQLLPDLLTGKWLSFTAYSYTRRDGGTGYFVVQHLGNRKSDLSEGTLAVWAQE